MVKAMAIEGVTYGKRRKVTNSIIAQSEIKKMSTGRTPRGAWRKEEAVGVLRASGDGAVWRSKVRSAGLRDCGQTDARAMHDKAQPHARLRGRPVLLCARCEAGKGGAGWRSCRRKT